MLREILDKTAERVGKDLDNQPEVKAELQYTMGQVYTALGVYDRAVLVLLSDHGEAFYDHQQWQHGTSLYEEEIHIPLIIRVPGGPPAGACAPSSSASRCPGPPSVSATPAMSSAGRCRASIGG